MTAEVIFFLAWLGPHIKGVSRFGKICKFFESVRHLLVNFFTKLNSISSFYSPIHHQENAGLSPWQKRKKKGSDGSTSRIIIHFGKYGQSRQGPTSCCTPRTTRSTSRNCRPSSSKTIRVVKRIFFVRIHNACTVYHVPCTIKIPFKSKKVDCLKN